MSKLQELIAQRQALEAEITALTAAERQGELAKIREAIGTFGFTADELFGKAKKAGKVSKSEVAPKYRDPESGSTWSGRGKPPAWIAGKERPPFLILG
jgi:DNA-binding protein H-NS